MKSFSRHAKLVLPDLTIGNIIFDEKFNAQLIIRALSLFLSVLIKLSLNK